MIYLCKPTGVVLGLLNGIDEESCSLTQSVSDPWELSFTLQRYIDGEETAHYSSTTEMMELLLDTGEEKVRFQIDKEPTISGDGVTESKEIVAHSIEIELQTKFLHNFKVNTGLKDSLEYLVGYYDDDDNFVNVNMNPYTNLPIDYIKVQNDFETALAKEKTRIQNMNLQINSSTGVVQNTEAAEYLNNLLFEYPRLGCDIVNGEVKIYLYKEFAPDNPLKYNMIIPMQKTKAYLLAGIDSLISFYQQYGNQLSMIDLAIENAEASGWSVGDIPEEYRHTKCTFDVESQDILSFFKQNLTSSLKVIADFDRYDRKVNLIDIDSGDEPFDTGVYLTYRNLVNSVDITSSSDDGIRTKYIPTGANNLGILYANFGENYIINLDWFMNKVDEYGEYQYVSESLRTKYNNWIAYRESTPVSYTINDVTYSFDSRRDAYRELTKLYNQYIIDIDTFKNRLPNDGCNIDYTTFSFEELNIAYKAYMNALEALEQLYMSHVGAISFERSTQTAKDSSNQIIPESSDKHIKNTWFWYDFEAYYYNIIPNVMNALLMYVFSNDGTLSVDNPVQYDSEKGEWKEYPGGNPWYNGNAERVTESKVDGYLYDVKLYGTVELEAKKKAWLEAAAVLYKPGFILKNGVPIDPNCDNLPIPADAYKIVNGESTSVLDTSKGYSYNIENASGYDLFTNGGYNKIKEQFTDHEMYIKEIGQYLDYVSVATRYNKLTKSTTKGVIVMAQDQLDILNPQLKNLENKKDNINAVRKQIADEVLMDEWSQFTASDLQIIHTLIREANYNNDTILITNRNDIATTVDVQKDLYEDAVKALVEKARPQLSFEISLDNLFAIDEFKSFKDSVKLFNFIRVSIDLYEDIFVKLRIVSIERNPLIPTEDLSLTFSNMTYSLQDPSDLAYMFGLEGGSSSSGGSGGGSGGTYGTNDAEINIGNNMLNALLNQSTYAAAMGITSGKYGVYDAGMTLADNILDKLMTNEAFKEAIALSILNQLTKSGRTLLDLLTGAGLFQDFKVGNVVISGKCVTDYIKSSNYTGNTFLPSATAGSFIDLKQGKFNFGGGNITFDGITLNICKGGIVYDGSNLTIQADTLKIGPRNVQDMIDAVDDKADDAATAAQQAINAASAAAAASNQAAKTATNYLTYSTGGGLIISQTANASSYGYNTQILSDGINFRYNNVVKATIDMNAYKVFDGNGTGTNNILAKFGVDGDGNGEMQLGKANEYHTYITNNGIYMKNGTNNLMSITRRDGVADIDTTGMYKINGNPVLTESGLKGSLGDLFAVKTLNLCTHSDIKGGSTEQGFLNIQIDSGLDGYVPISIAGYKFYNGSVGGGYKKMRILALYFETYENSANSKLYAKIHYQIKNDSTKAHSDIGLRIYLLTAREDVTINIATAVDPEYDDDDDELII